MLTRVILIDGRVIMSSLRQLRLLAVLLCLSLSSGCVSETSIQTGTDLPPESVNQSGDGSSNSQKPVIAAPDELHDVSGAMLAYRARFGGLPKSLEDLISVGLAQKAEAAVFEKYAYHSQGLGELKDGRRILVVDSAIRIDGFVWCIWEQVDKDKQRAGQSRKNQSLMVGLVALPELEQAALEQRL